MMSKDNWYDLNSQRVNISQTSCPDHTNTHYVVGLCRLDFAIWVSETKTSTEINPTLIWFSDSFSQPANTCLWFS